MRITLHSPGRAVGYALLLLVVAFIWAAFVANVPRLSEVSGPDYLVHNPVVALPILAAWTLLTFLLAKRYLRSVADPASEGFILGLVFLGAAVFFDLVVVALLVGEGLRHFTQVILWIGYAALLAVPWAVGSRSRATRRRNQGVTQPNV